MELEAEVLERVGTWESLSRWEQSELGKDLRHLGLSYGEIMELVPVKKSTLATWCRAIGLTPDQIEAIRERRAQEPGIPRDTQRRRRQEIEAIRAEAEAGSDVVAETPPRCSTVAGSASRTKPSYRSRPEGGSRARSARGRSGS